MPTTLAARWRQRDNAIARKASKLIEPWDDEEADDTPELQKPMAQPSSPISVASVLELKPIDVEIKPLVLPGAWVVVGKRGRPAFSSKMYDEVATVTTKAKKKKKKKVKAPVVEAAPLVVTLEEAPSSSKCLRALERSTAERAKAVTGAKVAKHWAAYQRAKQQQREALHELVATLALGDDEADAAAPAKKPTKDNKRNTSKDKARRRARSAAAAARCLLLEEDEDEGALAAEETPRPAPELSKVVVASAVNDKAAIEVKLPGAWQMVGKRGKVLNDFPPLKPSDNDDARVPRKTARSQKRVSSPKAKGSESHEESPTKAVKRDTAKRDKALQCSVM